MHPAFDNPAPTPNPQVTAYFDAVGVSDPEFIDVTYEAIAAGTALFPSGAERYRSVRTPYSLLIASEGLAESGLEVFVEMMHGQGWLYEQVLLTWQRGVVAGVATQLSQQGTLSDLPPVLNIAPPRGAPGQLIHGSSPMLSVFLGIPVPGRPTHTTDGSVRILSLTPLTPLEYKVIQSEGKDGAQRVSDNRADMGFHHVVVDSEEVCALIDRNLQAEA